MSECQQFICKNKMMFSARNAHLFREAGPATETVHTSCRPTGLGDTGDIDLQCRDRRCKMMVYKFRY